MGSRVLIADDNALIRRQIRKLLELSGEMQICEAADGEEAVEKAREYSPDVVVIDMVMPRMNGLSATRKIKEDDPHVRVLMFAFDKSTQLERESRQAGADAVLSKSEDSNRLAATVRALMHRPDHAGAA